jgi:hypothetical protein
MRNLESLRLLHQATRPETIPVTPETYRRLPLTVREWYGRRARMGMPMPTELAVRCLINDFLAAKFHCGGHKSVDGYKVKPFDSRLPKLMARIPAEVTQQQEAC